MVEHAPAPGTRQIAQPGADRAPRPAPSQRIDPKALRAWRLSAAIASGIFLLLTGGASLLLWQLGVRQWIVPLPLAFGVLNAILSIWVIPTVRWRRWRYEVTEREIDLQYGVLIITRTLIPMTRVQHVDTQQGPILRAFGLASVQIATAAGVHEIPALRLDVADELRDRISEWAGVAEDV